VWSAHCRQSCQPADSTSRVAVRSHWTTWIHVQCNREFTASGPVGRSRSGVSKPTPSRPLPTPLPGLAALRASWTPPESWGFAQGAAGAAGGPHYAPCRATPHDSGAPPESATIPRPFLSFGLNCRFAMRPHPKREPNGQALVADLSLF
jgi:hypothetical protein